MFESLKDIFPGIQQCISADLSVMRNCTQYGYLILSCSFGPKSSNVYIYIQTFPEKRLGPFKSLKT